MCVVLPALRRPYVVFVHCNISYVQHIGSVAHAHAHVQTKALLPHRAIVRSSFLSIVFDGHMKSNTFFYLSSLTIRYSFFNWISKLKRSNTKQTRNILSKTIWCSLNTQTYYMHSAQAAQHTEYRTWMCVACMLVLFTIFFLLFIWLWYLRFSCIVPFISMLYLSKRTE